MDEGVIASVSVGTVIFLALIIFTLGTGTGWFVARARQPKWSRESRYYFEQVDALLGAIPLATFVTDHKANIQAQNDLAMQLMKEVNWDESLPLLLNAAIERVFHSRLVETMELVVSETPARRVQVAVAPLDIPGTYMQALVLFTDSGNGSHRAEHYQRLIGTMAHELRTPLTAIMGHVEILNSCGMDEEALWRRSLGFVYGETERLARLVEDLLSLSRLDRIPPHIQQVNLRVAAEEAISALFDLVEKNNVSPILQSPADLPRVLADPDRIRQVFLNLLDNAIKYASNNLVTVRLIPNADIVAVEVNNRGPIIAPDELHHIFEPFWRGKETGAKGTGLGLAIVRAILDQHHVSIGVNSDAEQGTTFRFSLPITRSSETK